MEVKPKRPKLEERELVENLLRLSHSPNPTIALRATMFLLQSKFNWSAPSAAEKTLGKKEQANIDARVAHEDSEWGKLVN